MAYLLEFPLLLMLVMLPVAALAAYWLQHRSSRDRMAPAIPLVTLGGVLLVIAIFAHLMLAFLYLLSPTFIDPVENTVAAVSQSYARAEQIYQTQPASDDARFVLGPVTYIATAWIYQLVGSDVFAVKLLGFVCLLLGFALLALAVRQRFREQYILYCVALGGLSLFTLLFSNQGFWPSPDAFMTAVAALGLYTCLLRPGRIAWLLCGIALGIAIDVRLTGIIYFLPYIAWFIDRDGYRAPLVILPAAAVVALLPFLSVGKVSLANYLAGLQFATGDGISWALLLQSLLPMLFMLAPLVFFFAWQSGSVGIRSWLIRRKFVSAVSAAAIALGVLVGATPYSGSNHVLPFMPALALLLTFAAASVYAYRPTTRWSVYGFWTPTAAFLLAASIKAGLAFSDNLGAVSIGKADPASSVAAAASNHLLPSSDSPLTDGEGTDLQRR